MSSLQSIALLAHAARRFVSDMNVNTSSNRWRNMNKPQNRRQLREKAKVVSLSTTKRNKVFLRKIPHYKKPPTISSSHYSCNRVTFSTSCTCRSSRRLNSIRAPVARGDIGVVLATGTHQGRAHRCNYYMILALIQRSDTWAIRTWT